MCCNLNVYDGNCWLLDSRVESVKVDRFYKARVWLVWIYKMFQKLSSNQTINLVHKLLQRFNNKKLSTMKRV